MKIDKQSAIDHIRSVLDRHESLKNSTVESLSYEGEAELDTLYAWAFRRLCPSKSDHAVTFGRVHNLVPQRFETYKGILKALLAEYENDRLQTYEQFIRQELFGDFLEMAKYLIENEKLKDPAAVLAGGVLEQHLRRLCEKNGVAIPDKPKLDSMNAELAKKGVYNKTIQKQITAWAGLRNHAAHAEYDQYTIGQVELMIDGVQHFMATYQD